MKSNNSVKISTWYFKNKIEKAKGWGWGRCAKQQCEVDMKASTVSAGRGGAYLKFFDRPRQNYVMSVEFGMSRSFNNKYVLLYYTTNFGTTCKSEQF